MTSPVDGATSVSFSSFVDICVYFVRFDVESDFLFAENRGMTISVARRVPDQKCRHHPLPPLRFVMVSHLKFSFISHH